VGVVVGGGGCVLGVVVGALWVVGVCVVGVVGGAVRVVDGTVGGLGATVLADPGSVAGVPRGVVGATVIAGAGMVPRGAALGATLGASVMVGRAGTVVLVVTVAGGAGTLVVAGIALVGAVGPAATPAVRCAAVGGAVAARPPTSASTAPPEAAPHAARARLAGWRSTARVAARARSSSSRASISAVTVPSPERVDGPLDRAVVPSTGHRHRWASR
jgi:hypothetical protein